MKKIKYFLALFTLVVITSLGAFAQGGIVYQTWTALPESPTHYEVSWATCQCSPVFGDEIRLFVFNEQATSQDLNFTLTISDSGQTPVDHVISNLTLAATEMHQADCGKSSPPELTFSVPAGFNPSTLTISITHN